MIIKKVFDEIFDEEVHSDFLKFGRGEYNDRYLLDAKKHTKGWAIKTGPEYANYLVKNCMTRISGRVSVKGIIVSTIDLRDEIKFEIVKVGNFQGIRKIQIDTEVDVNEILELMRKFPRAFFALSFSGSGFVLKIKAKAPKSGKPGKESEEGPKAEFCSLKVDDEKILDEIFFDYRDFKEISISHTIKVEDIVYPDGFSKMKPEEVREKSKRKGVLIRKCVVDGMEKVSEARFTA